LQGFGLDQAPAGAGASSAGIDADFAIILIDTARTFGTASFADLRAQQRKRSIEPCRKVRQRRREYDINLGAIEQQRPETYCRYAIAVLERRNQIEAGAITGMAPRYALFALHTLELLEQFVYTDTDFVSQHTFLLNADSFRS